MKSNELKQVEERFVEGKILEERKMKGKKKERTDTNRL